ncbi:hypothetical protein TWF696_005335 [Orbilia brochopaga]|uniref:Uncharacterized protein n=1 Tax=Orbilia brochopaga TaxID=3140254 RepID=A0AAV9V3R9_9PEZI
MSNPSGSKNSYVANGQVLSSPPFTSRITRFSESVIQFLGLYTVSLLSFDPYASAEASSFATQNNSAMQGTSRGNGHSGFGGSTRQDPRGGGGGGGGQRLGTIDSVRGPECGSCG